MNRLKKMMVSIGQSLAKAQHELVIHVESEWSAFWLIDKKIYRRELSQVTRSVEQDEAIAVGNKARSYSHQGTSSSVETVSPLEYGRISSEEYLYDFLFPLCRSISKEADVSPWFFFPKVTVLTPAEFAYSQAEVWQRVLLRLGLPVHSFVSFPEIWSSFLHHKQLTTAAELLLIDIHATYIELSLLKDHHVIHSHRLWYGHEELFFQLIDYCRKEHVIDISPTVITQFFQEADTLHKKGAFVWRGHHVLTQQLQSLTVTKKELIKATRAFWERVASDAQSWLAEESTALQHINLEKADIFLRTELSLPNEFAEEMQKLFPQKMSYTSNQMVLDESFLRQYLHR